jgi:predicted RND superfamily exporter protein
MVLSIATSVHLYQEWVALSRTISDSRRLALAVIERLGMPCVLTAFTTALGLASLGVSDIPAVRQFGLVAALGVLCSLFLNLTLLPMAFARLRPEKRRRESPSRLTPALDRAVVLTVRAPVTIVVLALIVTIAAFAGITRIENDTDLISFLPEDAELVRDTRWVDRELIGTNTLELLVEREDGEPLVSPNDQRALDALARQIERLDEVTGTLTIASVLARVHQAEEGLDAPTLPQDAAGVRYAFDLMAESPRAEDLWRLITPDLRVARVAIRLRAIGTADGERVVDAIEEFADEALTPGLRASPTGDFLAVVRDSNLLVERQVSSFGLALATILATLALFLRSIRLMLAACIPNLVPIVWCLGAMGWFGITLSTATTMVASVVIGIAVDGTIHYLARFRREHHGDVAEAVRATTHATGRVLVIASVVLALGFWVGALGSFRPTIWFSALTGSTIVAALICDLIVLPACLVLLRPRCSTMRS